MKKIAVVAALIASCALSATPVFAQGILGSLGAYGYGYGTPYGGGGLLSSLAGSLLGGGYLPYGYGGYGGMMGSPYGYGGYGAYNPYSGFIPTANYYNPAVNPYAYSNGYGYTGVSTNPYGYSRYGTGYGYGYHHHHHHCM